MTRALLLLVLAACAPDAQSAPGASYTVTCWSGGGVVLERRVSAWTISGSIVRMTMADGSDVFGQGLACSFERTPREDGRAL